MLGGLMLFSLVSAVMIILPAITYFYAKEMGRKPKTWLLIGILFPGIATIILAILPRKEQLHSDKLKP
jgi:hypothetical protein